MKRSFSLNQDPYVPIRIKELITEDLTIDGEMSRWVRRSSVVISILDEHRPNCYFELGQASILLKTRLTFINEDFMKQTSIPFDVNHFHIDTYFSNDYENNYANLSEKIKNRLETLLTNDFK